MAPTFPTQNDGHVVARDLSTSTTSAESPPPPPAIGGNKRVRSDTDEIGEVDDSPSSKRQKTAESLSEDNTKKRTRDSTDETPGGDDASLAKRRKTTPDTVLVASKPSGFTTETVLSSRVTKMGRSRPWVFAYESAAGFSLYAFMKCPAAGCKHKFSEHPLEQGRAVNHFNECQVQIDSEKHMVKEYASQVVKDPTRKSDLTLEWAAMSNASTQIPKQSPSQQEPVALRRSNRKRAPPARYAFPRTTAFVGGGEKKAADGAKASGESRIVVKNLPLDVGESQLDAYFKSAVGGVVTLQILRDAGVSHGVAHVVFSRPDSAKKARRKVNGLSIDGKPIEVTVVESFEA